MEKAFNDFLKLIAVEKAFSLGFCKLLRSHARLTEYEKKEYLYIRGGYKREVAFICQGSAMSYLLRKGRQWVINIWKEGEVVIEGNTLLGPQHQDHNVQFLEHSIVLEIDLHEVNALQDEYAEVADLINCLLSYRLQRMDKLHQLMHMSPPEERLTRTMNDMERPFSLLSSAQKASYLGISRQTLYNLL